MSAPSSVRPSQLTAGLQRLEASARHRREGGEHDQDGHYRAATATLSRYRVSVRYSRHGHREISVCKLDRDGTYRHFGRDVVEAMSEAHRAVFGVGLEVAYSEPRKMGPEGAFWVVLHTAQDNIQDRLT